MKFTGFKYLLRLLMVLHGFNLVAQESPLIISDSIKPNYLITEITISGNQKTRDKIILRELSFSKGDNLDLKQLDAKIEESRNNLLKQPLFNFVTIEKEFSSDDLVKINILVEERWFIWPELVIVNNDRNFNTWWQNKDLGKLDYLLNVTQYNLLGLNHILQVGLSYGYTQELSAVYKNISLDKRQHHFLSLGTSWFRQKSVFVKTDNDIQLSYFSDVDEVFEGSHYRLEYAFRPRHKSIHSLKLTYNTVNASDSLVYHYPDFLGSSKTDYDFFTLQYQFLFDNRDSRSYPLSGNYFDIKIVKTGLGLLPDQTINLFHAILNTRQFYNISERFYGAHSLTIKKSLENEQPYYFKHGLGFKDFLRGFEYYVIDGEDYYLMKNTLKFELLPKKISYLNFIPIRKFKKIHYAIYLTSFFDIGFAHEKNVELSKNNMLTNKFLYSSGLGIDIATYYDWVFRFEYSFNNVGEHGLFIHFKSSI